MTTAHDTAATLEAAIDAHGANASGARTALDRAITAHVEAEVARRLAAAPEVEAAIVDYAHAAQSDFDAHEERSALRAAIAADKARAVEAADDAAFIRGRDAVRKHPEGWGLVARLTPDEARRLVDAFVRAVSPARYDKDTALTARAALLRALGVEA